MQSAHSIVGALAIGCASLLLQACGNSNAGSGSSGTYTSVGTDGLAMELKSGGSVVMTAAGLGSSSGTYTVDGEKIIVSIDNQKHTFIRDGNCIEDEQDMFGKLCKGGKAAAAANPSTRSVPTTPTGTYLASNADGGFKIEFKPGNKLTLWMTPISGKPETHEGTFAIEGDKIYATLEQGVPMVLRFVNNAYESTSFGLPMKFVKQ
jgi:hypothetical protein